MIAFIILENKATNLIPVRVLKVAFDFCFRRVTEEGYLLGKSLEVILNQHEELKIITLAFMLRNSRV